MVVSDGVYPRYEGSVSRPPSEAESLIVQVMYGCSYGQYTFCGCTSTTTGLGSPTSVAGRRLRIRVPKGE